MAKAASPKVPISTRVSPDMAGEIEALVTASGKSKSDVVEGLIRAGLAATEAGRTSGGTGGEMLAQVLAAIAELKAMGAGQAGNGQVTAALGGLRDETARLYDEVTRQQRDVAELVNADADGVRAEVAALKRALAVVLVEMLRRLHPDTSEEEIVRRVRKAFES